MHKKIFTILFVLLIPLTVNATLIDDFEDGSFLDGNPVQWECPVVGDYHCHYQISDSIKKNGSYSIRIGEATIQPSKFAIPINFQNDTWYGAWMYESNNNNDHSMFELFIEGALDAGSVIRIWDKGSGVDQWSAYTTGGYLDMEGENCVYAPETWFYLRLKKNSGSNTYSAEVYNDAGTLICSKYNYLPHVSGTPSHLRLLGDQAVPHTYWDSVTVGDEIPGITGAVCGNDLVEGNEACDGTDLNNQTCVSQGYESGTLTCNGTCTGFVTTECVSSSACLLDRTFDANITFSFDRTISLDANGSAQAQIILNQVLGDLPFSFTINSIVEQ